MLWEWKFNNNQEVTKAVMQRTRGRLSGTRFLEMARTMKKCIKS